MKKVFLFLIISFFGCTSEKKPNIQETTMEYLWNKIIELDGCALGNEYQTELQDKSVFNDTLWMQFLSKPKDSLKVFLITKLAVSDTTKTHICPLFNATEGELAVYSLQKIYQKNWFDFDEFKEYKLRSETEKEPPYSNEDSFQIWLQREVLQDSLKIEKMKNIWTQL